MDAMFVKDSHFKEYTALFLNVLPETSLNSYIYVHGVFLGSSSTSRDSSLSVGLGGLTASCRDTSVNRSQAVWQCNDKNNWFEPE